MYKLCRTEKSIARQRELENGFLEYMDTVPFFEMEISDLCRHLNIPRKTFYRYFGSKEDALYALIDHRLADLERLRLEYFSGNQRTLRQDALHFFSFWKEQHRFLDILNRNYLMGHVVVRSVLQSHMTLDMTDYQNASTNSRNDYMVNFMITGMMSMMIQWHHSGFQKSVEELADITQALFSQPISAMLDYPN